VNKSSNGAFILLNPGQRCLNGGFVGLFQNQAAGFFRDDVTGGDQVLWK